VVGATVPRPASELAQIAGLANPGPGDDSGAQWWALAAASLVLLTLLARYGTRVFSARARTSLR